MNVTVKNQDPKLIQNEGSGDLLLEQSRSIVAYESEYGLLSPDEQGRLVEGAHGGWSEFNYVKSAISSDPSIVEVTGERPHLEVTAVGVGEATVTVVDAFGDTHNTPIKVETNYIPLEDMGFVENNITVELGQLSPRLSDLITDGTRKVMTWDVDIAFECVAGAGTVVEAVSGNDGLSYRAIGSGTAFILMKMTGETPDDDIILDVLAITVPGTQVASTAEGSAASATVEANNIATINAIAEAKQEHSDLVLVANPGVELTDAAREAVVAMATGNTRIAGQFDIHFATTAG